MADQDNLNILADIAEDSVEGCHDHALSVDGAGNGWTSFNADHRHPVANWVIGTVNGHTHVISGVPAAAFQGPTKSQMPPVPPPPKVFDPR